MAVIVILMGIGLLGGRFVIKRAHKTEHQAILADLVKATEAYYIDHHKYPTIGVRNPTEGVFEKFDHAPLSLMDIYRWDFLGKGGYIDYSLDEVHGEAATFYYVDPGHSTTGKYYFCINSTNDGYWVCDGPGAPSASPSSTPSDIAAPNVRSTDYLSATYY